MSIFRPQPSKKQTEQKQSNQCDMIPQNTSQLGNFAGKSLTQKLTQKCSESFYDQIFNNCLKVTQTYNIFALKVTIYGTEAAAF